MEPYCKKLRAKKPCESRQNGKLHHEHPENEEKEGLIVWQRPNCVKGCLISEGILTLVPLPTKGAKSLSWAENLNFPPIKVKN